MVVCFLCNYGRPCRHSHRCVVHRLRVSLSRAESYIIAFGIVASAFAINYRGIVISTKIQLAIVVSIVALLIATIASSAFFVKPQNFEPFFAAGPLAVGTAAGVDFLVVHRI